MSLVKKFNTLNDDYRKSLIKKALTSATGVGEALVPEQLERVITNTIVRISPVIAMVSKRFFRGKFHEFNRLTALPGPGGAMGENATTPTRNSTYQRVSVELKTLKRKGGVTQFLQDSSADYIDSAAAEVENLLQAHVYDLENYTLFGNATANQYEYSGIDTFTTTNRTNEASGGAAISSTKTLDDMIDASNVKAGHKHRRAFLMSPEMLSKVTRLNNQFRLNQDNPSDGFAEIVIPGGWRLASYRGIPIIESGSMRPRAKMGAIALGNATGTGSGLGAGTYRVRVAKVAYDGESQASDEQTLAITNEDSFDITFTDEADALRYKVYFSTGGAGTETLKRVVSAPVYDGTGTITSRTTTITISSATAGSEVPTALQSDRPWVTDYTAGAPEEAIALWDLDEYQGMGKLVYTNDRGAAFGGLVTMEQLAKIETRIDFITLSFAALVPAFEQTSVWKRGLKVA